MFRFIVTFILIFFSPMLAQGQSESIFNSERCKTEAKKVSDLILDSTRCENDNDCIWEFFGCPWGCGSAINKAKLTEIQKAIGDYYTKECGSCRYRCKTRNLPVKLSCKKGQCIDINLKGR